MSQGSRVQRRPPRPRVRRGFGRLALGAFCLLAALAGPASAVTGSWSDRLADVVGAAGLAGSGHDVTVAVLDTWVDVAHPDFGGRAARGVTCSRGRCVPGADLPDACDAHGTHVAGIVASARYGVAPEAKVLPIRVLTSRSGSCVADAADVALGIRYAINHKIRLINVSLGSTFPFQDPHRVLPAAVTAATDAGDLVVVAAGNGKAAAATTYGKDALTVAALGPAGSIASYSQRGAGVDIAAPGGDPTTGSCNPDVCVVSTWQNGGYAADAGTSMAAPFVSGAAALLLSQDPHRSLADVRRTILSTARPLAGAGAGRLDVLAAVRLHAPKDVAHTGTDTPPTTSPGAIGVAPSITPVPGAGAAPGAGAGAGPAPTAGTGSSAAPGAGAAPAVTRSQDRAVAGADPSASSRSRIGPVQLLGILVVGGVGLAIFAVSAQRSRRER